MWQDRNGKFVPAPDGQPSRMAYAANAAYKTMDWMNYGMLIHP